MESWNFQQSTSILYYGPVIQSRTLLELDIWQSALIAVNPNGIIAWIESGPIVASLIQEISNQHGWDITDLGSSIQLIEGLEGEWIMPGFVDTHSVNDIFVHAHEFTLTFLEFSMPRSFPILERQFPAPLSTDMP